MKSSAFPEFMLPVLAPFGKGWVIRISENMHAAANQVRRLVSDHSIGNKLTDQGNTLNFEMMLPKLVSSIGKRSMNSARIGQLARHLHEATR